MSVMQQIHVPTPPLDTVRREELASMLEGEVFTDIATRMCYATDASIYQQLPMAVIYPKHGEDCAAIIEFSNRYSLPVIPRAAGTSLAGQCVGSGLVIDITRHMNQIIDIDLEAKRVRVQPGTIMQSLNDELHKQDMCVPLDPSTADRATVSGLVGNNAWGAHYLRNGSTRDHVISADVVLSDGSRVEFTHVDKEVLQYKQELNTLEGEIYRTIYNLVEQNRGLILEKFPDPNTTPNNMGYALDLLARGQPWEPESPCFNLAPFLCGSEGTLALITELTFKISPVPGKRTMVWGQFPMLFDALNAVPEILKQQPVALELLDRYLLDAALEHRLSHMEVPWMKGDPDAVLMIEFEDRPNEPASEQAETLIKHLSSLSRSQVFSILDKEHSAQAWKLRRAGLGLLMGKPSPVKAVTAIEDCAVSPEQLSEFILRIQEIMQQHRCDCVYYGSVGGGLVHLRPWLNIGTKDGRSRMVQIQTDVATAVAEFGGSVSAKHGDGRLRAHLLDTVLGFEIHPLLEQVKAIFDPHNLFNPGKILNAPPTTKNLRSQRKPELWKDEFNWGEDQDLRGAVGRCNGAGVCLKQPGRGVMCPSYMATHDERHTTRGRANVLRQILDGPEPLEALSSDAVTEAMDLCVSCKGCKAECPASVDMARIKAQVLQHRNRDIGVPLRSKLIGSLPELAKWGMKAPWLANAIMSNSLLRRAIGLTPKYSLPKLANRSWLDWWNKRPAKGDVDTKKRILLIVDPFTNYLEPEIGIAAVEFFEWCGYRVELSPCLSSGRMHISQGMLEDARKTLTHMVEQLYPAAAEGVPIIGLEPAELLTLHDEAMDLVEREDIRNKARILAVGTWMFEEWVCRLDRNEGVAIPVQKHAQRILVHTHCHQKALSEPEAAVDSLRLIPNTKVDAIESGCCGMAGAFGYEIEHADTSRAMGELSLLPAVRSADPDVTIVACGTSCRHQVSLGTKRGALHPAQVLARAVTSVKQ